MGQGYSMDRQSVRLPCEIDVVQCRDRPGDTHLSIHLGIGKVRLGHVFFDERYDDGKLWVLVVNNQCIPERFVSQDEAVDAMFSRIGLERPAGCCNGLSEPLEPGLYIGTRLIGGEREAGTTIVKVSGESPWLMMEEMKPTGSKIPPNHVKDLVRIDQLIVRNAP